MSVRAILALALLLVTLGLVGAAWNNGQPPRSSPRTQWRRTAQGWEAMPVHDQEPPLARPLRVNPLSLVALQVLAVVLLVAAGERSSGKRAESCTDPAPAGH